MSKTADALRIRIVLLGLRNAGKSSLMNNIFDKDVSIVSELPGTTTDPVARAMELDSLGPVTVIDTAGLDDEGAVGKERIRKTLERSDSADIHILVTRIDRDPTEEEIKAAEAVRGRKGILLTALTYADKTPCARKLEWVSAFNPCRIDNISKKGIDDLKKLLITFGGKTSVEPSPLEGLVSKGDIVLLVTPIDSAAPKGRLIMPQVETIRDCLDRDCAALVAKENDLENFYNSLAVRPKLVITDSQAFHKAASDIPSDQMLTSFSILFARKKGELSELIKGITEIRKTPGIPRVLVIEACSHHRQDDDIGTVKIPRLFRKLVNTDAVFEYTRSLPEADELSKYSMIIHCAACMITRTAMLSRIEKIKQSGTPVTNYGLFLGWANGLLPRALEPFDDIYAQWRDFKFS
ncbi:MAG: [FeFe] hydrogenase H-cluster maturation GTPase HydF [Spirochaetia bacterium]|jgi:[FeFe] hydrogenase H-cluster maturation GTPase HydF|nr:[FeFe] hydrogenase H-cluster maturation GTPase HydF [Spirochaetia bacterium]